MKYFNPKNKPVVTVGDTLDMICAIDNSQDAQEFIREYAVYQQVGNPTLSWMQAEEMAKHNIGYIAGYCSDEKRRHIYQTFGVGHPILKGI